LGTDYLDVYLLHWPARYTPQSNWGQSLEYNPNMELYSTGRASFEEIAEAMQLSVPAVKSLLFRARDQLRAALEPYAGEGST
jgi:diketogulonate reductase-like aldo/keto reductase